MASRAVKKPVYDGNTCLLYDYMVAQGLTEEEIAQRMGIDKEQRALWGEEIYNWAPWEPEKGEKIHDETPQKAKKKKESFS